MRKMELEITVDTLLLLIKKNRQLLEMAEKYYEIVNSKSIQLNRRKLNIAFKDLEIKKTGFGLIGFSLASRGIDVDKEFAKSFVIFFNELKKRNHKIGTEFRNEFTSQFPDEVALGKELKTKRMVDFVTNILFIQFLRDRDDFNKKGTYNPEIVKKIYDDGKICKLRREIFEKVSLGEPLDIVLRNSVKSYIKKCKEVAREFPGYKDNNFFLFKLIFLRIIMIQDAEMKERILSNAMSHSSFK